MKLAAKLSWQCVGLTYGRLLTDSYYFGSLDDRVEGFIDVETD